MSHIKLAILPMVPEPEPIETRNHGGLPATIPRGKSRRTWWLGVPGLLAAAGLIWLTPWRSGPTRIVLPAGVSEQDFARAQRDWKQRYGKRPDDLDVVSWLAESAVAEGDLESAVACFEQIPSTHAVYGRSARHQQGQVLQALNRICAAETNLREFIRLESDAPGRRNDMLVDAMQRLRSLLELELRFEERHTLLRQMFQSGDGELFDVLAFFFPTLLRWNGPSAISRAEAVNAADPACFEIRRAIGRYRTGQGRLDEARGILEECLREKPSDLTTYAFLLECEHERGGTTAIADAVAGLPPPSDDEPWLLLELRGHVCHDAQKFTEAIECFERVLRADPANAACHQGIATACSQLPDPDRRQRELRIVTCLTRIQVRLARIIMHGPSLEPIVEIVESCEQAGLQDHALGMVRLGLRIYPQAQELLVLRDRLQSVDKAADLHP